MLVMWRDRFLVREIGAMINLFARFRILSLVICQCVLLWISNSAANLRPMLPKGLVNKLATSWKPMFPTTFLERTMSTTAVLGYCGAATDLIVVNFLAQNDVATLANQWLKHPGSSLFAVVLYS